MFQVLRDRTKPTLELVEAFSKDELDWFQKYETETELSRAVSRLFPEPSVER